MSELNAAAFDVAFSDALDAAIDAYSEIYPDFGAAIAPYRLSFVTSPAALDDARAAFTRSHARYSVIDTDADLDDEFTSLRRRRFIMDRAARIRVGLFGGKGETIEEDDQVH